MRPVFGNYNRAGTFQASDTPLLVVDTDLVIRDVNPACLEVTARTSDELLGTSMFEAFRGNQQTWNSLVTALARESLGHRQARRTAERLQHALSSGIIMEQAKGVTAAREGISIDQAFTRLRQHARRHGAVLHDVARAVVELGLSV